MSRRPPTTPASRTPDPNPLPPHVAIRHAILRRTLGRRAADRYARRALADLDAAAAPAGSPPRPPC